jgi:hypothetical protein
MKAIQLINNVNNKEEKNTSTENLGSITVTLALIVSLRLTNNSVMLLLLSLLQFFSSPTPCINATMLGIKPLNP